MINSPYYRKYIRPYFREPKKKAYTMLGLTLLSLSVFGSFAIRPALVTVVRLNNEIEELRAADKQLEKKIQNLYKVQTQYNKAKKDLYLLDLALPSDKNISKLLENLTLMSGKSQVTIRSIRFRKPIRVPGAEDLRAIPMDISLSGDYTAIADFFKLLESSTRQVEIKGMNFVGRETREGLSLRTSFKLYAYFLSAEK